MRVLIVLSLVLLPLAGCVNDNAMTARDGLGDALDVAAGLLEGAPQLTGIYSIEPFAERHDADGDIWLYLDSKPGDGRAPAWAYEYTDGQSSVTVLIASRIGMIAKALEKDAANEPLGAWNIDSDKAIANLRSHESWVEPTSESSFFWELCNWEGTLLWFIEHDTPDNSYEFAVDAKSGEVVEAPTGSSSGHFQTAGSFGGGILVDAERQGTLRGPGQLELEYNTQGGLEGTITVENSDGEEIYREDIPQIGSRQSRTWISNAMLPADTYTLRIEGTGILDLDYFFSGSWEST